MGRPGVVYHDVAMAAEKLAAQGRNPTIESVRAIIGSGSTATVGPYLRAWRTKQDSSRQLALKENIPEELLSVIKGLWERVFVDAEAKFETERLEMQQSLNDLRQQISSLQAEHNRTQQQLALNTEDKLNLSNEKLVLEQSIERQAQRIREIAAEKNSAVIQLEAQTTRISELHQLHGQVQKNLEHYREASLEQRRQDQKAHEQQRHQQEQVIQQLRHEYSQIQHQLAIAQQQLASEQKESERLDGLVKQMKNTQESMDKILTETKEELMKSSHACEHWQQQYQALHARAEQIEMAARESQTQLAALAQKLSITEESLREVTAQNRLLIKDKWILEQERTAS